MSSYSRYARWIHSAVGAALAVLMVTVGVHAQAKSRWSKAAPFPEPEEELYGVAANGKMYVMGGFGARGVPPGMNWEYDPATDKWTKKTSMPLKVHHQALAEYNGKIYMFGGFKAYFPPGQKGGFAGWEPVNNSWMYDPATDTWKALAPMPTKRGSAIAQVVAGKIYVIGGAIPEPGSGEVAVFANRPARSVGTNEMYDPETNTWTERSPMPTPRNHAFSGEVNGKIYVIGGRINSPFITVASDLDIVEEYDPVKNIWGASKTPMPTARSGGGCATYDGKIYVAGGEIQTRSLLAAFRAFEAYDPATNSWQILPSMPVPRHGVAVAVLGNKMHFVSGKITSGGAPDVKLATTEHDVYDLE
jgi:N-acetylneuraminic acid mutarotase